MDGFAEVESVVAAVRAEVADMGAFRSPRKNSRSLARTALGLAAQMDASPHENTARELRLTMAELLRLYGDQAGATERSGIDEVRKARENRVRRALGAAADGGATQA